MESLKKQIINDHPRLDHGMCEMLAWYGDPEHPERDVLLGELIEKTKDLKESPHRPKLEPEIVCITITNQE